MKRDSHEIVCTARRRQEKTTKGWSNAEPSPQYTLFFVSIGLHYLFALCFVLFSCRSVSDMGRVRSHFSTPHSAHTHQWNRTHTRRSRRHLVCCVFHFSAFFYVVIESRWHERRTSSTPSSGRVCFRFDSHWNNIKDALTKGTSSDLVGLTTRTIVERALMCFVCATQAKFRKCVVNAPASMRSRVRRHFFLFIFECSFRCIFHRI